MLNKYYSTALHSQVADPRMLNKEMSQSIDSRSESRLYIDILRGYLCTGSDLPYKAMTSNRYWLSTSCIVMWVPRAC
jgi:hypothetical protein